VTDVERIRRGWERTGESFLKKAFTTREINYCRAFPDPWPHLAGRFAAKESVIKALGTGLEPRDVEIRRAGFGPPRVVLLGSAKRIADSKGVTEIKVSISHSGGIALAFAVALAGSMTSRRPSS